MRWLSGRLGREDDGAVAVMVAILMVALLGMAMIVVDVGAVYAERRQLQNGADAAVLAVVRDCAAGACDTQIGPTSRAGSYARENANDFRTTVTEVCGSGSNLSPCTSPTGAGPWDCQALPTALSSAGYVQVRTLTQTTDPSDPSVVRPLLAQVGAPGYPGTTVRACARASWGGAGGLTSAMPLTVSNCEFEDIVGSPPSSFAPAPPYPPYPSASWEKTLYFHDTTEAAANDCPAGPSGGDDPLSGGFGWLESTNCQATSTVDGWYDSSPGASPGNDCKASQLDDMLGQVVYIPIYDQTNGLNGAGGQYGMRGYAAFVLTGYYLGGSYKEKSIISGKVPCGTTPTTGSQRCISGFFTQALTPVTGTVGGPSLGAPPVIQMSG